MIKDQTSDWDLFFDDFNEELKSRQMLHGSIPVLVKEYPTIPYDDCEPVSVIEPDLENGPWIAGGAALRWYQGLSVGENDIDVFCCNSRQAIEVIDRIKSYGRFFVKFQSENAVTIEYINKENRNLSWTIQVITRRYFSSLQEIIDNFDLTVCQIGTCGAEWLLGENTAQDIRERNLRFVGELAPQAVKRLVKYWTYGYRPVPGTLESIQENSNTCWNYTPEEDYHNAF